MSIRAIPRLYKYVCADRAIEILTNCTMRFTQPHLANDPFECQLTLDRNGVLVHYRQFLISNYPHLSTVEVEDLVERGEGESMQIALERHHAVRHSFGMLSL